MIEFMKPNLLYVNFQQKKLERKKKDLYETKNQNKKMISMKQKVIIFNHVQLFLL